MEATAPDTILDFCTELPDVIMVCKTGTIPFVSAVGQTKSKEPIENTAVTTRESDFPIFSPPFILILLHRGVWKLFWLGCFISFM